jgi:putative peptide zinc metalloprotease protein
MLKEQKKIEECTSFLKQISLFSKCTPAELLELASLFKPIHYKEHDIIVQQGQNLDTLFLIASGYVEVSRQETIGKKIQTEILATLSEGDPIGFDSLGFFSKTGVRTATLTALSEVKAFKLDLSDFSRFLNKHPQSMSNLKAEADVIIHHHFIKQLTIFSKTSPELLQKVAMQAIEFEVPEKNIFFSQGDEADYCYFLLEGEAEVLTKNNAGFDTPVATLKTGDIFGELGLIVDAKRNATVKSKSRCRLLKIDSNSFHELVADAATKDFDLITQVIMSKTRPERVPDITVHERVNPGKETTYILKNLNNGKYFMLSEQTLFLWNLLDASHTIQDLAFEFLLKYKELAEDEIGAFVLSLMNNGFVKMPALNRFLNPPQPSAGRVWFDNLCKLLTWQHSIKNVDVRVTQIYQNFGYLFYKKASLYIMAFIAILGFISFVLFLNHAETLIAATPHAWILLILIIPANILIIPAHELAHALTTKHYGYAVNRLGIGWYWVGPIAFADTSEMWLGTKKQRITVNIAGIYINIVISGLLTFLAYLIPEPTVAAFLWLLAFSSYLLAFYNLDTIIELDGYYVLMDALDRPNLRKDATLWLIRDLKKTFTSKAHFKQYLPEMTYWVVTLGFVVLATGLVYVTQVYIFQNMIPETIGKFPTHDCRWVLSFIFISLSFVNLYSRIKDEARKEKEYERTDLSD